MNLHDILNRLEAQEREFVRAPVLAPVVRGQAVAVKIAGVLCRLKTDAPTSGWAVLQPQSSDRATYLRAATPGEIERYLHLLPQVRLLAVARVKSGWLALSAQNGDARFRLKGAIPVLFSAENVQPFDAITARFDGAHFWFEGFDSRRSPAFAAYLRQALASEILPNALAKRGLSTEERDAYAWAWEKLKEMRVLGTEARLQRALSHAEGELVSFIEREDAFTVTYRVGQYQHVSTLRKDDLTVLTSGICLSDRDEDFDLTSLVGVMREAAGRDEW